MADQRAAQRNEASPARWQVNDLAIADNLTQASAFSSQKWCIGADGDCAMYAPHLKLGVESHAFVGSEAYAIRGKLLTTVAMEGSPGKDPP
jgi:hypothetical protein